MGEQRDYSAQNEALINRWERDKNRREARAEASEENFKKTLADLLKQEEVKKTLAREGREAVDAKERGRIDPLLNRVQGGGGSMFDNDRSTIIRGPEGDLDSSITGEEPRPWEEDY